MLPLRVPLEIGDETANLLVPLYLVIAAGLIVSFLARAPSAGRRARGSDPWPERLRWLLAATLVLYAIQASYSEDVAERDREPRLLPRPVRGHVRAAASRSSGPARLLRTTLFAVGIVAVGCALIGIYQYFARDLFLNPELFDANELHVYFRVNSIFFDPNIFGRYLALGLTALARVPRLGRRPPRPRTRRGRLRDRAPRARVQLLVDQLRRAARRARHRRAAALELARRGRVRRVSGWWRSRRW